MGKGLSGMKRISISISLLILLAYLLSACATVAESLDSNSSDPQFPAYVYDSALSLKSYKLALQYASVLFKIPCYCDCGRASGHQSLHDCFFKGDGFNDHASGCEVCGLEMVDVAQWIRDGKSIKQIRAMIDVKYAPYGHGTNTPAVE